MACLLSTAVFANLCLYDGGSAHAFADRAYSKGRGRIGEHLFISGLSYPQIAVAFSRTARTDAVTRQWLAQIQRMWRQFVVDGGVLGIDAQIADRAAGMLTPMEYDNTEYNEKYVLGTLERLAYATALEARVHNQPLTLADHPQTWHAAIGFTANVNLVAVR